MSSSLKFRLFQQYQPKAASPKTSSRCPPPSLSGCSTRPRRNLVVPGLQRGLVCGDLYLQGAFGKVQRGQSGDVGDAEMLTGNERHGLQTLIQIRVKIDHAYFAALGQFRDLLVG